MASQALLHGQLPALPFAEHQRFSAFLDTVVPLWVSLGSCSQLVLPFLPPSSRIGLFSKHTWKAMWMTPPPPPITSGTTTRLWPLPCAAACPSSEPMPGPWLWEGPGGHTDLSSSTGQRHLQLLAVGATLRMNKDRASLFQELRTWQIRWNVSDKELMSVSAWLFLRFLNVLAKFTLSSGPGKQFLYSVVQPALFPQVASDLIMVQASINLWPGQHVTAACQLDVCTSYAALCFSSWTFYAEMGTSRLYPVNWKVLGKLISCLTCILAFTVRAKIQSRVSVHLIALNSDQTPEDTLSAKQTFQYFLDNPMFTVTQFDYQLQPRSDQLSLEKPLMSCLQL